MGFEAIVEARIREAQDAGAFDNLPGSGKPLRFDARESLAGENWLGFKILQRGGVLPEWLELAREIELVQARLERLDREHAAVVAAAARVGDWARYAEAIRAARRAYEDLARALRRRQDRFNMDAPGLLCERPGIWVQHHLERLDCRLREAGASEDFVAAASRRTADDEAPRERRLWGRHAPYRVAQRDRAASNRR